jgi:lysophospholipase L1-like esterase
VGAVWLLAERARLRRIEVLPSVCASLDAHLLPDGHSNGATASVTEQRPLQLVTLGDSLMAGVGAESPDESLPVLVGRAVAAELVRPVRVCNFGRSGARVADLTDQVARLDGTATPDIVVIGVGANDATHLTPSRRFEAELRHAVSACRAVAGAEIVLGGLPEFRSVRAFASPLRWAAARHGDVLHELQRKVAAMYDGVWFADVKATAGPMFIRDRTMFCQDRVHPSAAGYACLAAGLAPVVIEAARRVTARLPE